MRRFPAKADLPLIVQRNSDTPETRSLTLETTERIVVPLSIEHPTSLQLSAERVFELSKDDPRQRSFLIVNIDFD